MRVAIYSRYSSDLQDPRSIADQIAAAREYAQRNEWTIVAEYQDAAISGSSKHNRPGLNELLRAANERRFDVVLTESLDRLSRDLEDIAGIHKRLCFVDVKIVTLADGIVGKMHVGLKGMIASMFLDDLALKTKRGQAGRVKAGRIPGGRCFGYDLVASLTDRGLRQVNPSESAIVLRIFNEYVAGVSTLQIATALNVEGIPSPRGGTWSQSTLTGNAKRGNGIINNRLYTGKIVYNRQSFIKDPATGKRQARQNSRDSWLENDVPDLRIIPDELFEAAQIRRLRQGSREVHQRRRPKHLLSGLVFCGCCGGSMIVLRDDYLGCSASRARGTCHNRKTIRVAEIQNRILESLQAHLLQPEIVKVAVEAYRVERDRISRANAKRQREAERDLSAIDRKIQAVITAIEAGGDPRALAARLNELEAERTNLTRESAPAGDVVSLHPKAAALYAETVRNLHSVLSAGRETSRQAIDLVRELIDKIIATPDEGGGPMNLELVGNLAALLVKRSETTPARLTVAGPRNQTQSQ